MDYLSLGKNSDLNMNLTILNVSCVPGNVLIKFQATYISNCEFDYHILQKELQLVPKVNEDLDVGDYCLVQDKPLGLWHRGKILDKVKQTYEVVLMDQGKIEKVYFQQIASATRELFVLPPKVVNGIFSNILPLDEKWSSRSVKYFSALVGEQINGHVKTTLPVPHQVILFEAPKIINYAVELNVAKYMDSDTFCLFVEIIHNLPANSLGKQIPDLLQKKPTSDVSLGFSDTHPHIQKILEYLRPVISVGKMEKIKISAALSPDRFYCRILAWEAEFQTLTASLCSYYESLKTKEISTGENYESLCAAKRKDRIWYRGVIQALVTSSDVKVWFIDVGCSETIPSGDIFELKEEFLVLPMLTIPCSLSRVINHVEGTKCMQLSLLKQALTGQIVIAHIEHFCSEGQIFNISLFEKEYELSPDCHLTNQKVPVFYPSTINEDTEDKETSPDMNLDTCSISKAVDTGKLISHKSVEMELDSVHVGYVEYVLNPSNFWIRTDEYQSEFTSMMEKIAEQYNKCELGEMVIENPQPDQLCCALYPKDGHYYRAKITEVLNSSISVYFIDFGNTEVVPFYYVKVLLPKFSSLPALAMCCTLAYAYPQDDVWVKDANDTFKTIVNGKALLCHVLAKRKFKYVVEVRLFDSSENSDVVSLLVQAGYAEYWKVDLNSESVKPACQLPKKSTKMSKSTKSPKMSYKTSNNKSPVIRGCGKKGDVEVSLRDWANKTQTEKQMSSFYDASNTESSKVFPVNFKQYTFKPGAVRYVICSHVESPGHFWCQNSSSVAALDALMGEIQIFYKSCNSRYQHGQIACIAKSSSTGKYCRAAVVNNVSKTEVDVIFVDYGTSKRVLISDLKEIKPQFLEWEGQAFRCCLSSVLRSSQIRHMWSSNTCKDFEYFVGSATELKCTILTVFSSHSGGLSNAVDLETSCWNANNWLASEGHLLCQSVAPSVHLHSFLYSSFDLKAGCKEDIHISHINNTGTFYCQLARNEKNAERLMRNVSELGKKINPETGKKVKELNIVRDDQDGHFYRVMTCADKADNLQAFFVDYGDTNPVKKTKLLPIPDDAVDILFEPMHAIPCYLSGLKEVDFTDEAIAWFKEQCIGKTISTVVVSIDIEGQFEMDLYCGNLSVNSKIKEILGVECKQKISKNESQWNETDGCSAFSVCAKRHTSQDLSRKSDSYGKIHISDLNGNICESLDGNEPNGENSCFPPPSKLLKSSELPQTILEVGSSHLVYASCISSPSKFYIQLAESEKQIIQLEEELNDISFQYIDINHLEKGALVVAQYADDRGFYRAEIKDVFKSDSFEVEFIDYGNSAKVDFPSIFQLPERFFNIPRLSISAFLTGVQGCQDGEWSTNVVDKFYKEIANKAISCTLISRHDSEWEVSITSNGRCVTEFLQISDIPSEQFALDKKCTVSRSNIVLKPSQIEKVENIYMSESKVLFVTLASHSEEYRISEQISAVVAQANNRLAIKDISEGTVCLAKSKKMQIWLRARVEKVFLKTNEISVFFVDHGAHEVLSMLNAKSLPAAMQSLPYQAIPCMWSGMENIGVDFFQSQMRSLLQKEVRVLFLTFSETEDCWKVDLLVEDVMLLEHLKKMETKNEVPCSMFKIDNLMASIPKLSLRCLEVRAGFVTAFLDPFSFSVQLEDSIVSMHTLSELLRKQANDLPPLTVDSIRLGSACLVKCLEIGDDWCRAEITSCNMTSILLNFPDFGIFKSIPYSDYSNLKVISKEIASLPALTFRCKLHGVLPNNGMGWSPAAIKYCMDFIQDHNLIILPVKSVDHNFTEVSIYGKGNLAEKLICKKLAIDSSDHRDISRGYSKAHYQKSTSGNGRIEDLE